MVSKRKWSTHLTAGLLLSATGYAGADQSEKFQLKEFRQNSYAMVQLGYASSDANASEVQQAFDKEGVTATVESVDNSRRGLGFGVGYEVHPSFAAELAYLDLGQADVEFTTLAPVANLADAHPESGSGFSLSGIYRHRFRHPGELRLRVGLFSWEADYKTVGAGNRTVTDSESGSTIYWGGGFAYAFTKKVSGFGEVQRFEFDRHGTLYFTVGLEWRFLR